MPNKSTNALASQTYTAGTKRQAKASSTITAEPMAKRARSLPAAIPSTIEPDASTIKADSPETQPSLSSPIGAAEKSETIDPLLEFAAESIYKALATAATKTGYPLKKFLVLLGQLLSPPISRLPSPTAQAVHNYHDAMLAYRRPPADKSTSSMQP